jgi:hypothetical protein
MTQAKGDEMKIVVIGGSGPIGSKLVKKLREDGHDPLAAPPDSGVDTLTGEGLGDRRAPRDRRGQPAAGPGRRRRDHRAGLCGCLRPEPGEDCNTLAGRFPGSTLGEALRPVPRSDGTTDLYITHDRFHGQFCADMPAGQAARMAATQRPATQEALTEPSGERPLWRELPSWFLIAEEDRNIPAVLQRALPAAI